MFYITCNNETYESEQKMYFARFSSLMCKNEIEKHAWTSESKNGQLKETKNGAFFISDVINNMKDPSSD